MQQQVSVLDTLVYLFDYLVYEKKSRPSVEEIHQELGAAGFQKEDIDFAMSWLLDLNDLQEGALMQAPSDQAVRVYTDTESNKIAVSGRECLDELVALGVISPRLREILIVKLMTLDEMNLTEDEVKWVALMALFNRPGQEANAAWLEHNLLKNGVFQVH